jgi:hypothetical protein
MPTWLIIARIPCRSPMAFHGFLIRCWNFGHTHRLMVLARYHVREGAMRPYLVAVICLPSVLGGKVKRWQATTRHTSPPWHPEARHSIFLTKLRRSGHADQCLEGKMVHVCAP